MHMGTVRVREEGKVTIAGSAAVENDWLVIDQSSYESKFSG